MCALNLKENSKASFEDTVLKVAMSEAKSRVENEYRGTFSKDTKLDSKGLISDIITQSSSNWDYENKAKWQIFRAFGLKTLWNSKILALASKFLRLKLHYIIEF